MQIFAFQNTARQVAVGETDVYGSVFGVESVGLLPVKGL